MARKTNTPYYAPSELLIDAVFLGSGYFDWNSDDSCFALGSARCDECENLILSRPCSCTHRSIEPDTGCNGYVEIDPPVSLTYYHLPDMIISPDEAAKRLEGIPLCLVHFNNREPSYALAVTGTGMDFRWYICEAFMRLKFLPPFFVTDLPALAGKGHSPREKWIIDGCILSCAFAAEQASKRIGSLAERLPA